MTKLPTLKDLDVTEANGGLFIEGELFIPPMVLLKDLKQMAIEWVNYLDTNPGAITFMDKDGIGYGGMPTVLSGRDSTLLKILFKHLFGLDEVDLK